MQHKYACLQARRGHLHIALTGSRPPLSARGTLQSRLVLPVAECGVDRLLPEVPALEGAVISS